MVIIGHFARRVWPLKLTVPILDAAAVLKLPQGLFELPWLLMGAASGLSRLGKICGEALFATVEGVDVLG
jgi:uncharacterized membrane protein SpoIIM required for sporulation